MPRTRAAQKPPVHLSIGSTSLTAEDLARLDLAGVASGDRYATMSPVDG